MSGLNRKQKRIEARREYERFTKMWREDMRLAGIYGKKNPYKRLTFSQWYDRYETAMNKVVKQEPSLQNLPYEDPWAEQLDERTVPVKPEEGERGVATIQIVGDEEV